MVVKGRSKSNAAQEDILSPERDSENDSDAPEEESNVNTSYNIKNMDKNRKSKKRWVFDGKRYLVVRGNWS